MAGQNGVSLKRKIQRLGASSLIVTLPKDWARRNKVNVGDMLHIYDDGDKLIIAPENASLKVSLEFSLSHFSVEKHAPRITLCTYVFGFDKITFKSNKTIKDPVIDRIGRMEHLLPGTRVSVEEKQKIIVELGEKDRDLLDLLVNYGRSISRVLNRLSGFLEGKVHLTKEDLDLEYNNLLQLNYLLLRTANSVKTTDIMEERQAKYMVSASNLIGIVNDSVYKFGLDLLYMIDYLKPSEKQRLAFLLQILEVAVSTVVLSLEPPSVKKAEESYWKVRSILDLEGNIREIVENDTPAFTYLLAKIIDIARIIDIAENVILCHALITKFNETGKEEAQ
ncbi:MAG: AbrB/MazE/SpoVT family DNA-binding domain-containing protein [Desulfurococcales archaeon]|nr:AbrB/MazE/SpoVT family DNA-binding domain-containing protein [Desulfurococcales archaeon]MCE4622585.1 AbrB/MazE/SpoVT family DNA-binding domain-containing protein [Desulfurococcales archaeon]MCE4627446.1 AbrB/MazE/SpoVT family DNA-binding domain-containing protein [Desulfurococcales archaeon]MCE4629665.1 AbrB/MazE/SpoVT family DNA-binding domain-containing protein [Desulfurococcales archaeon]